MKLVPSTRVQVPLALSDRLLGLGRSSVTLKLLLASVALIDEAGDRIENCCGITTVLVYDTPARLKLMATAGCDWLSVTSPA